jgi:hypothetical protein
MSSTAQVSPAPVRAPTRALASSKFVSLSSTMNEVVLPFKSPTNDRAASALKLISHERTERSGYFRLSRICVATTRSMAYYALVSRLRKAGLQFESRLPDSDLRGCDVVLTTKEEARRLGPKAVALEDLDEDPGVLKGQIVSKLADGDEPLFVGIDPGERIGLAVFYGEANLAFGTFDSVGSVSSRVASFARVPAHRFVVRIGNGNRQVAARLVEAVRREALGATVELVDESGTSVRNPRMKGLQGDQSAAAKIAFRKGEVVSPGNSRTGA